MTHFFTGLALLGVGAVIGALIFLKVFLLICKESMVMKIKMADQEIIQCNMVPTNQYQALLTICEGAHDFVQQIEEGDLAEVSTDPIDTMLEGMDSLLAAVDKNQGIS